MSTAKDLLSIQFDRCLFEVSASAVINPFFEKRIINNLLQLEAITEKYRNEKELIPNTITEDLLLKKLLIIKGDSLSVNQKKLLFSIRELSNLCYCLYRLNSQADDMQFVAKLIVDNWHDSFLNGLIYYILNCWEYSELDSFKIIHKITIEKLSNYSGKKKRFLKLQECIDFIKIGGASRLGAILKTKGLSLLSAPEYLGLREICISYEYFSKVIESYYERNYSSTIGLESILSIHLNDKTNKRVLTKFIKFADVHYSEDKQNQLKKIALHYIGDPAIQSKWASFPKATIEEKDLIIEAQAILNKWITKMFISVFFEKCIDDRRRKVFWLKFVKHIDDFKIIGSKSVKQNLQFDNRLEDALSHHFMQTSSLKIETSALVMYIKDYILIEFSDIGALYAYRKNGANAKLINRQTIDSIDSIKNPYLDNLCATSTYYYNNVYRNEGRMIHSGYWEERLIKWINQILNVYV